MSALFVAVGVREGRVLGRGDPDLGLIKFLRLNPPRRVTSTRILTCTCTDEEMTIPLNPHKKSMYFNEMLNCDQNRPGSVFLFSFTTRVVYKAVKTDKNLEEISEVGDVSIVGTLTHFFAFLIKSGIV